MAPKTAGPQIFDEENRNPYKPSVLKSFIPSKAHKRSPSAGDAIAARRMKENSPVGGGVAPILPLDHPHAYPQRPLRERGHNRDAPDSGRPSRRNSREKPTRKGLHQKTKSTVSLKSLLRKETGDVSPDEQQTRERKPKKTKSSTSLSAIFKRSNRGKKDGSKQPKDKENQSPVGTSSKPPSPIWAQQATQPLNDLTGTSPVSDRARTLDEEMSLYTPKGYSPSKQRNFHDYQQPTLAKRPAMRPRPNSDYISSGSSMSSTGQESTHRPTTQHRGWNRLSAEQSRKPVASEAPMNNGERRVSGPKKGSRVMAAISAFNAKEKGEEVRKDVMKPREIEGAFEKLLDSRNIPHNMRDKMRSLDTNIKEDFIRKDKAESAITSGSRPGTTSSQKSRGNEVTADDGAKSGKASKTRPLSLTFTISKGDSSPTKKQRSGSSHSHKRNKSADTPRSPTSRSLAPSGSMSAITSDPTDFIHYLREVQRPEIIEVGKLHKLRILLRNETVAWVDSFISNGGMDEIVSLLYRIMKVEWREEHEDSLLHETLLCLKALCTTSAALQRLLSIESELFPALLRMLFDEEKKGPSEFTTRGIIISLLFTHLSTASPEELPSRAQRILSYLKDPSPPEENQPLNFIANIYQPRPYRVWCKEITNVTKEVFWIFLHHFNVIAINKPAEDPEGNTLSFAQRHFPPPHSPVPAAPHVGGVEWDATTYLATHLDLMNGLIAALPTCEERNNLREELRSSGMEKPMGGSMRTCKEKFHVALHDSLRTWVSAAAEDGWDHSFVREGPPRDGRGMVYRSPVKSPKKKAGGVSDDAPKLDLPGPNKAPVEDGGWL